MNRWFVLFYLLVTLLLGLRPLWPAAYRWAKGSHLGAYNMFTASVDREVTVWLEAENGQKVSIDHEQYFWMNPLINATHSHVDPLVVQRFADDLKNRRGVLQKLPPNADITEWTLKVRLRYRKNQGRWQEIRANSAASTSRTPGHQTK